MPPTDSRCAPTPSSLCFAGPAPRACRARAPTPCPASTPSVSTPRSGRTHHRPQGPRMLELLLHFMCFFLLLPGEFLSGKQRSLLFTTGRKAAATRLGQGLSTGRMAAAARPGQGGGRETEAPIGEMMVQILKLRWMAIGEERRLEDDDWGRGTADGIAWKRYYFLFKKLHVKEVAGMNFLFQL